MHKLGIFDDKRNCMCFEGMSRAQVKRALDNAWKVCEGVGGHGVATMLLPLA